MIAKTLEESSNPTASVKYPEIMGPIKLPTK